jgi:hypothetical protein
VPLIKAIVSRNFTEIRRRLSYINIYQVIQGPLEPEELTKQVIYSKPPEHVDPFYESLLSLVCKYLKLRYHHDPKGDVIMPTGQSVAITPERCGSYSQYIGAGSPGSPLDEQLCSLLYLRELRDDPKPLMFQGNLKVIGDSGGKSRLILIGFPPVQAKLRGLQQYLFRVLRATPTDCTYDQTAGHRFLVQKQLEGKTLYSIDLKDCSWHLPFSLQAKLLDLIGASELKQYFDLPVSNDGVLVRILKGQAMGLRPSFPLFSLTHNLVLIGLCKWLGISVLDSFRVLGDDLIIANKTLLEHYLRFCVCYEIPLSTHKCLIGRAAEFAGKVFIYGVDVTPIRWRRLDRNSLSCLFYQYKAIIGKNVFKLITDRGAFLTLGGLAKSVGGLGISNFDKNQPVTAKHLKVRLGIVTSLIENVGSFNPRGNTLKLPQPKYTGTHLPTPWFLRKLSAALQSEIVMTNYGILPYLGNPFRISKQLGIDIPLLPGFRPTVKKPFMASQEHIIWRYKHYGQSRKDLYTEILRSTDELFDRRRETYKISQEALKTEETNRSIDNESGDGIYCKTLFNE